MNLNIEFAFMCPHCSALSPRHKLRNVGFKLLTNVVHVHLLLKWIKQTVSESNKHFIIKLKLKANLRHVEFTVIDSDHGQKLYYKLINLLKFK